MKIGGDKCRKWSQGKWISINGLASVSLREINTRGVSPSNSKKRERYLQRQQKKFLYQQRSLFGFGLRDRRVAGSFCWKKKMKRWKKAPARENCFSFLLLLFKDIWKQRTTAARNFYAAFNVSPLHPLLQWFNKFQFVFWCRLCLLTPKSFKHGSKTHRHTRTQLWTAFLAVFFSRCQQNLTLCCLPALTRYMIASLYSRAPAFAPLTPPTLHYHFLRYAINSQFICK